MDINFNNHDDESQSESAYNYLGRGLQFLIQTPVFIIVGVIVMIWEAVNKIFSAVYQQGSHLAGQAARGQATGASAAHVKVPMMPIDNYSHLSIDEVLSNLEGLSPTELNVVKKFETDHDNRQVILDAIDQRLSGVH